eukprot:TRINITY_DN13177_c0_g1_i3.p1 TRINITY_DN13177_c0_g1~~TRINITY_DN13177_c0_g1_i3.p1  ORF type:complete len:166 (-),score=23.71 TRINITY_DN13177_c0_g1_i3:34-531(-)
MRTRKIFKQIDANTSEDKRDTIDLTLLDRPESKENSANSQASQDGAAKTSASSRFMLLAGTLDGSVNCVSPLEELQYRRFYHLHSHLTQQLSHYAGLNPRAFRVFKSEDVHQHGVSKKNIVDGELLLQFLSLDMYQQRKLARLVGTSADHIIDSLLEIDLSTRFF